MKTNKKARAANAGRINERTDAEIVRESGNEVNVNDCSAFIPSWLDDAGLSQAQFRAYCHVSRRGHCFESVPNMAGVCRMNEKTMRKTLAFLVRENLITKEKRDGTTTVYRIAPLPKEARPPLPKEARGDPYQKRLTKVIPQQGNPTKEIQRVAGTTSESATPFDQKRKKEKPAAYRIRMKNAFAEIEQKLSEVKHTYAEHALNSFAKTLDNRGWLHSDGSQINDLLAYFLGFVESSFPKLHAVLIANNNNNKWKTYR